MRYAVVFEKGPTSYGAYVPDLPGCVAVGKTLPEVKKLIAEAIALHLTAMSEEGQAIAEPSSRCEYVRLKAASLTQSRSRKSSPSSPRGALSI